MRPKGSPSRCQYRPESSSGESTRKSSARSPPTSARSASPSPTRARACATSARRSSAGPARPGRSEHVMSKIAQQRRNGRIPRHRRVRKKIHGTAARPRLAVFRSNKHLVLQVIDDEAGRTIAAASTNEPGERATGQGGGSVAAASRMGQLVAERAKAAGIEKVVFDRGGFAYHGRVAAAADAAREAGLE